MSSFQIISCPFQFQNLIFHSTISESDSERNIKIIQVVVLASQNKLTKNHIFNCKNSSAGSKPLPSFLNDMFTAFNFAFEMDNSLIGLIRSTCRRVRKRLYNTCECIYLPRHALCHVYCTLMIS